VHLTVKSIAPEQKANIRGICSSLSKKLGLGICGCKFLETAPVPDTALSQALNESCGSCALCGVTKKDSLLDVGYIIPINKGGTNDLSNVQVFVEKGEPLEYLNLEFSC
jgi:5-methylcytosine-specific restriction endonuclease McrA